MCAQQSSAWGGAVSQERQHQTRLAQEVEVGNPGEHGVQEEGQEGDEVVLRRPDGVALVALIDGVWAEPVRTGRMSS